MPEQVEARPCRISAADLEQWRRDEAVVIVDTRTPDEYRDARIPRSINLPAYALKTKTYLMSKRVLLIGRPGSGAELEPTCLNLRKAGFTSVGILEGGLNRWVRTVGTVVGDAAARGSLSRLAPADFARDPAADDWLVVDVSRQGIAHAEQTLPHSIHIPFGASDRFRDQVRDAIRERHGRRNPFVVLVDGAGELQQRLQTAVESLDIPNAYVLEGGFEGYRRYAARSGSGIRPGRRGGDPNACGSQ